MTDADLFDLSLGLLDEPLRQRAAALRMYAVSIRGGPRTRRTDIAELVDLAFEAAHVGDQDAAAVCLAKAEALVPPSRKASDRPGKFRMTRRKLRAQWAARRCQCCGKWCFATEEAAQARMALLRQVHPGSELQRAYQCPRTEWWHLTRDASHASEEVRS